MCSETHGNLGTEHENFRFPCSDLKVFHDVKKEEMTADHNERVEEMRRVMENIHLGLVMDDGGGESGEGSESVEGGGGGGEGPVAEPLIPDVSVLGVLGIENLILLAALIDVYRLVGLEKGEDRYRVHTTYCPRQTQYQRA